MAGAVCFWGDSMAAGMCSNSTCMADYISASENIYNGGFGGQDTAYIKSQFLLLSERRQWAQVFWGGQHVNGTAQAEADNVLAMIAALPHRDFIIVSGINDGHLAAQQGPGGSQYLKVMDYNAILQAAYPDNYLDLHGIMVADGIANADSQSVNYDAPPSYWQPTDVHFNTAGGTKAAQEMRSKLMALNFMGASALRTQIARCGNR